MASYVLRSTPTICEFFVCSVMKVTIAISTDFKIRKISIVDNIQ